MEVYRSIIALNYIIYQYFISGTYLRITNNKNLSLKIPVFDCKCIKYFFKIKNHELTPFKYRTLSNMKQMNITDFKVVNSEDKKIKCQNNTFYIFQYNRKKSKYNLVRKYYTDIIEQKPLVFINTTYIKIVTDNWGIENFPGTLTFELFIEEPLINKMVFVLLIILLTTLVYILNYRCIRSFELKDPSLSDFIISSTDLVSYKNINSEISECVICFEEFKDEDKLRLLSCNHFFHPECVDKWLIAHSNKCPCCRSEIMVLERDEMNI